MKYPVSAGLMSGLPVAAAGLIVAGDAFAIVVERACPIAN
jgi:hypothetical protein